MLHVKIKEIKRASGRGRRNFSIRSFYSTLSLHFTPSKFLQSSIWRHIARILYKYSADCFHVSIFLTIFKIFSLPYSITKKHSSSCFHMLNISALSIASSGNTIKFLIKFCYRFETYELRRIILKRNRKGSKSRWGNWKIKLTLYCHSLLLLLLTIVDKEIIGL